MSNKLQNILWWCSGVDRSILVKYPSEWGKYFGIGGTILFTALMASFAGGYAFFIAFDDWRLAILFGIFWGLLIFNLDRYIISSMGKGDGTAKITLDEWKNAAPRIVLAVLLGFVIAVPLELKVFEQEIKVEIESIINEKRQEMTAGLKDMRERKAALETEIKNLKTETKESGDNTDNGDDPVIRPLKAEISGIEAQSQSLRNKISKCEINIQKIERVIASISDPARISRREKEIDNIKQERAGMNKKLELMGRQISQKKDSIRNRYSELVGDFKKTEDVNNSVILAKKAEKATLDILIASEEGTFTNKAKQYNGLMAQLEALSRLSYRRDTVFNYQPAYTGSSTANDTILQSSSSMRQVLRIDEERTVVFYAKWLLTLLLIAIEITPILFKMMAEAGPYDDRIEEIRYQSEVERQVFISNINQKVNTDLKIGQEINQQKMQAEMMANENLLKEIANAQHEVIQIAIDEWRKKEKEKAVTNPDAYFQFTSSNDAVV